MFQYTKENILNSVPKCTYFDGNGKETSVMSSAVSIVIEGIGEYVLGNIVEAVYATEGKLGDVSTLTLSEEDLHVGEGEVILTFRVITPNQQLAEFASPNWNVFGKPIIVGYNASELEDVKKAIELAIPDGNKFITVSEDGSNLTIKGTSKYITFDKVAVTYTNNDKKEVTLPIELTTKLVKNVEPFATKEWIIENLRFPTYPNIRYASASTMPTADLYTEVAFTYRVPRVGLGGLSGVGQALDAVTRHIFYVPKNDGETFASLFGKTVIWPEGADSDESAN